MESLTPFFFLFDFLRQGFFIGLETSSVDQMASNSEIRLSVSRELGLVVCMDAAVPCPSPTEFAFKRSLLLNLLKIFSTFSNIWNRHHVLDSLSALSALLPG